MRKTTIYLSDEHSSYLRDAARRSRKSLTALIREVIEAQRESNLRPRVDIIGIVHSKSKIPASDKAAWRAEYLKHLQEKYARRRADR